MNNPLNFSDFFNLYNGFLNPLDYLHLWYLNYSFHYLFYYLFYLNYFGDNPKDFKNIVNIYNIHDLSVDHSNDTFINIQSDSKLSLYFLKLFQESLNEHSQVELNFSWFLIAKSVYVLHSYWLGNILNDLYKPIHLIYLNAINDLLLEKFS